MKSGKASDIDDAAIILLAVIAGGYLQHKFHLAKEIGYLVGLVCAVFIASAAIVLIIFLRRRQRQLKPERWEKMNGHQFEDQIVIWLKQCGYKQVRKTEYYDMGIDIIAAKPGVVLGVQVKRSNRPVGVNAVRAAVAGLRGYACTQAMVVTNATFTPAAIRLAEANDCKLIAGKELIAGIN